MGEILDEAHKKMLLKIVENPEMLGNPKVADALVKIANVLEKMDKRREQEKKANKKEEDGGVVFIDDIKDEKDK